MDQSVAPTSSKVVIMANQKSVLAAFLLTFFFGPLGLLYASIMGGIIMIVISAIVAFFTLGFGLIITFPICIIWSIVAVNSFNAEQLKLAKEV